MHILFIHCSREWSGTARAFAVAARGLAARGHTARFLVEPESSVEHAVTRMANVASKLGSGEEESRGIAPFEVVQFHCETGWFRGGWKLKNLFRHWDADVVFVTTEHEHLLAAFACWLGRRGSIVRRSGAGCPLKMGAAGKFAAWLTKTTYLFADEESVAASKLPRKAGKPIVAMPGVDTSRYPERANGDGTNDGPDGLGLRYIICVYDPDSRGRAATAIRTVSMLAPRHPYLRLMIFGAGSDSEELRMQAAALGVLDLVSFLGERDDHLMLMRDADLGWVVAECDTAAFGILDLMALSVPVIAPEGSIAEAYVANLITGTLIPPDDAATTAAAVVSLLTNEEQRTTIGAAGRARVAREFPEQGMVEGFEQAVNQAAGRHR